MRWGAPAGRFGVVRALTDAQVRQIRDELEERERIEALRCRYTLRAIGDRYGVSYECIRRIEAGECYKYAGI